MNQNAGKTEFIMKIYIDKWEGFFSYGINEMMNLLARYTLKISAGKFPFRPFLSA